MQFRVDLAYTQYQARKKLWFRLLLKFFLKRQKRKLFPFISMNAKTGKAFIEELTPKARLFNPWILSYLFPLPTYVLISQLVYIPWFRYYGHLLLTKKRNVDYFLSATCDSGGQQSSSLWGYLPRLVIFKNLISGARDYSKYYGFKIRPHPRGHNRAWGWGWETDLRKRIREHKKPEWGSWWLTVPSLNLRHDKTGEKAVPHCRPDVSQNSRNSGNLKTSMFLG